MQWRVNRLSCWLLNKQINKQGQKIYTMTMEQTMGTSVVEQQLRYAKVSYRWVAWWWPCIKPWNINQLQWWCCKMKLTWWVLLSKISISHFWKYTLKSTRNFSVLTILINLKRIDRWPHNKVTDVSDLTKKPATSSKHKPEETPPQRKHKKWPQDRMEGRLNDSKSLMHVKELQQQYTWHWPPTIASSLISSVPNVEVTH